MNFVIVQRIRVVHRATTIAIRGQLINIHCSIKVRKSLHLLRSFSILPRAGGNANSTFLEQLE